MFSILFFIHPLGTDKENLFDDQEPLKLEIISFILMTLMCDSGVMLLGEIRFITLREERVKVDLEICS